MPKTQKKYGVRRRLNTRKKYRKSTKTLKIQRKSKKSKKNLKIQRKSKKSRRHYGGGAGWGVGWRPGWSPFARKKEKPSGHGTTIIPHKQSNAGKIPTPKKLKVAEARAVEEEEEETPCFCFNACTTENPCIKLEACCKREVHKECIVDWVLASSDAGNSCPYCKNETEYFVWVQTLLTPEELKQLSQRKPLVDPYLDLPTGNNGGGGGAGNNGGGGGSSVMAEARRQLSQQDIRAMASLGLFAR